MKLIVIRKIHNHGFGLFFRYYHFLVFCPPVNIFNIFLSFQMRAWDYLVVDWNITWHLIFRVMWGNAYVDQIDAFKDWEVIDKFVTVFFWYTIGIVISLGIKFPISKVRSHGTNSRHLARLWQLAMPFNSHFSAHEIWGNEWNKAWSNPICHKGLYSKDVGLPWVSLFPINKCAQDCVNLILWVFISLR